MAAYLPGMTLHPLYCARILVTSHAFSGICACSNFDHAWALSMRACLTILYYFIIDTCNHNHHVHVALEQVVGIWDSLRLYTCALTLYHCFQKGRVGGGGTTK